MKKLFQNICLLIVPVIMIGALITSCEDEESGTPRIRYVRGTNPESGDSLYAGAFLGNLIAIMGENLGSTREVWFNDQQAELTPTYITNSSILVRVPSEAPVEVTNTLLLVFANGSTLSYDFVVEIPAPEIASMESEFVADGDIALINGAYFFDVTPVEVLFTAVGGGQIAGEVISVTPTQLEVVVPDGADTGPITVITNFGETESTLHFRDDRNIILNYDDLTAAGSWRPGPVSNIDPLDGNYLRLFGTLDANERSEDNFESQFWGHTRYPEERNLFEGFPEDLVLKFEARVVEWSGSYLQICWGPWDNAGNQEVWSNLNGRGLWRPWEENGGTFSTNGKWITVAIPLTDMKYSHNQDGGNNAWPEDMPFDKDVAGTLSFWVVATQDADNSPVEIHIDNVRIVEK